MLIEEQMKSLREKLNNRKLNLNISNSKGVGTEELKEIEKTINEIRYALRDLVNSTYKMVVKTRNEFQKTDKKASEYWGE